MSLWRASLAGLLAILAFRADYTSADDQIQAWLDRLSKASQSLSYDGVFIYQKEGRTDVMRLIRSVDAAGERERLIALTGPAREVIRDNNMVSCIMPSDHAGAVGIRRASSPFFTVGPQHYEALKSFYSFSLGGEERIAGHLAQELIIEPKDHLRYGYHLWIDKDTALLLKSRIVDAGDKNLEQIMFATVNILDHVPAEMFKPTVQGKHLSWRIDEQEPQVTSRDCWRVNWLPPGFSLTAHEMRRMPPDDRQVEHMVFSDGLALVSVFMEREHASPMPEGWSHRGAVHTFTRRLGDHFVTVVGEVPAQTVRQISESVSYRGDSRRDSGGNSGRDSGGDSK